MKYIRKKGRWSNGESKYIVEQDNRYILTIPKLEALLKLLRPVDNETKPSQKSQNLHMEEDKSCLKE